MCATLRSALSVAMAIVADAFANLIDYLATEEAVLKTFRAIDLRACLRTGGPGGQSEDTERFKYYKVLNRIEKKNHARSKAANTSMGSKAMRQPNSGPRI